MHVHIIRSVVNIYCSVISGYSVAMVEKLRGYTKIRQTPCVQASR